MHRFQRSQINTGGWIQADRSNQTDREPRMPGLTSNQWQVSIPSLRSPLCRMLDSIFCDVVHPVRAWMCGDRTAGARWKWWFNQLKNRAKSLSRLTNRRNEGKNRSLDTMFQRPARGWVYSAGSNVAEEQTPEHAAKKTAAKASAPATHADPNKSNPPADRNSLFLLCPAGLVFLRP